MRVLTRDKKPYGLSRENMMGRRAWFAFEGKTEFTFGRGRSTYGAKKEGGWKGTPNCDFPGQVVKMRIAG